MNTVISRWFLKFTIMAAGLAIVLSAASTTGWAAALTEKIEQAIATASERYDSGEIVAGKPYQAVISDGISLRFSYEEFDADLSHAFDLYAEALAGTLGQAKQTAATPARQVAQQSPPPRQEQVKKQAAPANDRIAALMQAEKSTNKKMVVSSVPQENFDVYGQFRASHSARIQQQDMAAEADMATVLSQRQAAEEQRVRQLQQQQELQSQAMQWQAQLDKQASESARKAAEWEAQHSFGAYATTFLATVAQTAVGSFTGGLLNPIATELANKAVDKWFNIDPGTIDQYQTDDD
ncbi:MAG: hypothetical protein IH612_20120 [Desulfofustis sp.]|nr:hypothetical protein [Desulfofustis sp.]